MEHSGYVVRPDYRVDILARRNRVTVTVDGEVLADSERTLLVDEQDHGLVFYFPPDDVRLGRFVADDRTSRCPYKGTATYRRLDGPRARGPGRGATRTPSPRWPAWPGTWPSSRTWSTSGWAWRTRPCRADDRRRRRPDRSARPASRACSTVFDVRADGRPAATSGRATVAPGGWSTAASCWPRPSWPRRRSSRTTGCAPPMPSSSGPSTTSGTSGSTSTSPIGGGRSPGRSSPWARATAAARRSPCCSTRRPTT